MIKKCELCRKEITGFPYKCKYCNKIYCLKHHLPENHKCMFSSSKRLVPQKLEESRTYYHDSDVSKRPQKSKKEKLKKKRKKRKN